MKPDTSVLFSQEVVASTCNIADIIRNIKEKNYKMMEQYPDLDFKIELVIRELMANAIKYGSTAKGESIICINCLKKDDIIKITVEDSGTGFSWDKLNLKEMPMLAESGRGLPLVYELADQLEFNDSGNKVTVYLRG